jgi:hypothetical protein
MREYYCCIIQALALTKTIRMKALPRFISIPLTIMMYLLELFQVHINLTYIIQYFWRGYSTYLDTRSIIGNASGSSEEPI